MKDKEKSLKEPKFKQSSCDKLCLQNNKILFLLFYKICIYKFKLLKNFLFIKNKNQKINKLYFYKTY
jgi:hypothetical protein